jgi:hypothetical protein
VIQHLLKLSGRKLASWRSQASDCEFANREFADSRVPVPHASPREAYSFVDIGQVAILSQGGTLCTQWGAEVSLLQSTKGHDELLNRLKTYGLQSSYLVVKYLELVICCQAPITQRVHHFG